MTESEFTRDRLTTEDDGNVVRRGFLPTTTWAPTAVSRDRRLLTWWWQGAVLLDSGTMSLALKSVPDSLLWNFIDLPERSSKFELLEEGNKRPDPIVEFAREWGVLGMCRHGMPSTHASACRPKARPLPALPSPYLGTLYVDERGRSSGMLGAGSVSAPSPMPRGYEPVRDWIELAAEARSLLRIAAALHDGDHAPPMDLELVRVAVAKRDALLDPDEGALTRSEIERWLGPGSVESGLTAYAVQQWISMAGIRPIFSWRDRPRIDFGSPATLKPRLFSALALQLLYLVAGTGKHAVCSACGRPYLRRKRFPKKGQSNYCDDCGKRAANRAAYRRRRDGSTAP